ncbi:uncharacterized protein LOC129942771 [Eupeodes corollae]|uniref:uncharacterized protein LOC129942771 n=1 Tax=Eupeodes corollae TaxID=290404 RepID=UPI0024906177|nr:uncharacterized protein LOC129942771 [Eupeodes corollae]
MDSLNDNPVIICKEFKRNLIRKIKENPCIWTNKNKCETESDCVASAERDEAWRKIERELGSNYCSLDKIKETWSVLEKRYFRLIFLRTIERNFEQPSWLFFHEMMFLYDHVKETIQNMLGGISPPLFKPNPNAVTPQRLRCPCCIYIAADIDSDPDITFLEIKEEKEFESDNNFTTEESLENYPETVKDLMDSEIVRSIKDGENQSCIMKNSLVPQQNQITNFSVGTPSQDFIRNKTFQVSNELPHVQVAPTTFENSTGNRPSEDTFLPIRQNHPMEVIDLEKPDNPNVFKHLTPSLVTNKSSEDQSKNFEEQRSQLNDKLRNVLTLDQNSNESLVNQSVISVKLRDVTWSQTIQAIKANPATYLLYTYTNRKEYTDAWKKTAEQLGNVSLGSLKKRWKSIKTYYLKELMIEHYANGKTKSNWKHFDELEFLRPHMQQNIEDVHRTRVQIQNFISNKTGESIKDVECSLKLSAVGINDNKIGYVSYIREFVNYAITFNVQKQRSASDMNENTNVFISYQSLPANIPFGTECKQPKLNTSSVFLDPKTLPLLKNRPVTVSAVEAFQNRDLNENVTAPPPAKKLRKSTDSERNTENEFGISRNQTLQHMPDLPTEQRNKLSNLTAGQTAVTSIANLTAEQSFMTYKPGLTTTQPIVTNALPNFTTAQPFITSKESLITSQTSITSQPSLITAPSSFTAVQPRKSVTSNFTTVPTVKTAASNFATSLPVMTPKSCLPTVQTVTTLKPGVTSLKPVGTKVQTAKPNILKEKAPQNVMPTLDLTLDDNVPIIQNRALNKIDTATNRTDLNDDCVYTCKEFPSLDLTTDEVMDDGHNESREGKDIPVKNKNDCNNVVCLDDDNDSVGSYEEVIVYLSNDM